MHSCNVIRKKKKSIANRTKQNIPTITYIATLNAILDKLSFKKKKAKTKYIFRSLQGICLTKKKIKLIKCKRNKKIEKQKFSGKYMMV